jgi:ubiquitin-conjugating enzyme E2 Q
VKYMSLGFGPSVEHEILTQPYVVDLLISFCYASAKSHRLREYPTGMGLSVPPIVVPGQVSIQNAGYPMQEIQVLPSMHSIGKAAKKVKYDINKQEIILDQEMPIDVSHRSWVVLSGFSGGKSFS